MPPKARGRRAQQKYGSSVTETPPTSQNGRTSALAGDTASQLASAEMLARRAARFSAVPPNNRYLQMKDKRDELRDSYIRAGKIQDITKPVTLEEAITLVGECEDMCPEFERHEREFQKNMHKLETIPGTKSIDHTLAVKTFHRPAAGDLQPLPSDVRPPLVLKKTLDYLIDKVLAENSLEFCHHFIRDRTRSIRQDFTLQNFKGVETVDACERIARFHILSAHEMCDVPEFSVQQEIEQMRKVLITLMELYTDNRAAGKRPYPNEQEFRAYYMLTHIHDPNVAKDTDNLTMDVLYSLPMLFSRYLFECVRLAREAYGRHPTCVSAALHTSSAIFRALASPDIPYLVGCVIASNVASFREAAFQAMNYAASRAPERIPVSALSCQLGYDSPQHLVDDLKDNGIPVIHDNGELIVALPQKDEDGQFYLRLAGRALFETRQNFVSRPDGLSLTDIVNGKAELLPKSAARMIRNAYLECWSQAGFEQGPIQHDFPKQLDSTLELTILSDGDVDANNIEMESSPLSASPISAHIPTANFPSFYNQLTHKPNWHDNNVPQQPTSINFLQAPTPPVTFKWPQPFSMPNGPDTSRPLSFGSVNQQSPSASSNVSGFAFAGSSAFNSTVQPLQTTTSFYPTTTSQNGFSFISPVTTNSNTQITKPFVNNYSTPNFLQPTLQFAVPPPSIFRHTASPRKSSWEISPGSRASQPFVPESSVVTKPTWTISTEPQTPNPFPLPSVPEPPKSQWKISFPNTSSAAPLAATTPQYPTGTSISNGTKFSNPFTMPPNAAANGANLSNHWVRSEPISKTSVGAQTAISPSDVGSCTFPIMFGSIPSTFPTETVSARVDDHVNQVQSEESSLHQEASYMVSEKSSPTPLETTPTPPENESPPETILDEGMPSSSPPATEIEEQEKTSESSDMSDKTAEEEPEPPKRATWHDVWGKIGSTDLRENAPLLPVNYTPKRNVNGLVSPAFQAGTMARLELRRKNRGESTIQEQTLLEMSSDAGTENMSENQNDDIRNGTVPSNKGKERQVSLPDQTSSCLFERRVHTNNADLIQPLDLHKLVRTKIEPRVREFRHGRTNNGRELWKLLVCVDSQRKEALDYCFQKFRAPLENLPTSAPDDPAYRTCARIGHAGVDAEFAMVDGLSLRPGKKSAKPAAFDNAAALIFQLRECTTSNDADVFWEEERLRLGSFLARIPNDGLPLLVLAQPSESAVEVFGPMAYQKMDLAGLQTNRQVCAAEVAVIPLTPSKQSDASLYQWLDSLVSVSIPSILSKLTLDSSSTCLEKGWSVGKIGPDKSSPTSRRASRSSEWKVQHVRKNRKRDRTKTRDGVEDAVESLRAVLEGVRSELKER